jgi:integrase/recombinase XerD
MALGKRKAKGFTPELYKEVLNYLENETPYPKRNKVMFLLSIRAGLRAAEIGNLRWEHVMNTRGEIGETIRITDECSKGTHGGREFHMADDLILALKEHYDGYETKPAPDDHVCLNRWGYRFIPNAVARIFHVWLSCELNWRGYSSHSGRRTFITNAARKISLCGGSIYDVSKMAGHKDLQTTQVYIDANLDAQKAVVNMI